MTAQRTIADRPFLRLFDPGEHSRTDDWTIRRAFDELRWPDLKTKKYSYDGPRWVRLWEQFESELASAHRSHSPMRISDIGSRELKAFQLWMQEDGRFPLPKGASSVNKAIKEIALIMRLAADEGIEVQNTRPPKQVKTGSRPRYYLDGPTVDKLWAKTHGLDWPPRLAKQRRIGGFRGSGVEPSVFWRSLLILLRNYGMRVQDLCAYAKGKSPITWGDVHLDPRSPNPESLETWPLGWLYYKAAKTEDSSGREYYLPLTPSARAAIDRLRAGAFALGGGHIDLSQPIFCVPKSHGLTEKFKTLQQSAGVATRAGEAYELEDFRKTVATYAAPIDSELGYALCGWGPGGGVKAKHYQQPEPLLVAKLHRVPLPDCFSEWIDPAQAQAVAEFVRRFD